MTLRQIYTIKNNQLIITLPDSFKGKSKVSVTVEDIVDSKSEKYELLANVANDPIFQSDINEIKEDFKISDSE